METDSAPDAPSPDEFVVPDQTKSSVHFRPWLVSISAFTVLAVGVGIGVFVGDSKSGEPYAMPLTSTSVSSGTKWVPSPDWSVFCLRLDANVGHLKETKSRAGKLAALESAQEIFKDMETLGDGDVMRVFASMASLVIEDLADKFQDETTSPDESAVALEWLKAMVVFDGTCISANSDMLNIS